MSNFGKIHNPMKKTPLLLFITLGITSIISQVILIRELSITFLGDELFMGLALGIWFGGTTIGSFLGGKLSEKFKKNNPLTCNLLLISFLLPITIILIRFSASTFGIGGLPNMYTALILSTLICTPLCLVIGSLFPIGIKYISSNQGTQTSIISNAYLIETLGFAIGGLTYNFFLIKTFEFSTTLLLAFLNLIVAIFTASPKEKILKILLSLLCIITLLSTISHISSILNYQTQKFRFPNLVESKNSIYGNITVTEEVGQYNFFESGLLIGPDRDSEGSEYLVHLTLLEHENPKKVLLIGGGWSGIIKEILKYPSIELIDYVELDPELITTVENYLEDDLKEALHNPKVKIHNIDGRKFLKENTTKYDVIISNLPNPQSVLINRFYTKEFFQDARARLDDNGIFATTLNFPTEYLSKESRLLGASIYKTLKVSFQDILILPEYNLLFLASPSQTLTHDDSIINQRFRDTKIDTTFVTESYLSYRLTSNLIKTITGQFENNKEAKNNTDFYPVAYFYNTAFAQTYFNFSTARILRNISNNSTLVILFITVFILTPLIIFRKKLNIALLSISLAGFTMMAIETILVFSFQVTLGLIFHKIALLITAILASLAIGNFIAAKFFRNPKKALKVIFVFLSLFCVSLIPILKLLQSEIAFLLVAAVSGILIGTVFPLASQMFIKGKQIGRKSGILYGFDLVGSFVGTILVTLFLIPIVGINNTLILLAIINIVTFIRA